MLLAQAQDLLGGQREHREQAVLPADRGQVERPDLPRGGELVAHLAHAGAHRVELIGPLRDQRGIGEHQPDRRRAVIGRHRPGRAGQRIAVREDRRKLARLLRHHVDRADAVAVEAEILVAAIGDDRLGHFGEDPAYAVGIPLHPLAEALVGKVEQRQHAVLRDELGDLVPFGRRIVDAGGIVAAAVEQDRIARRRIAQRGAQRFHIRRAVGRGVLEIPRLEPEVLQDLRVVGPARRTHQHFADARPLGQRRRQPYRAGAAGGLHALNPALHRGIFAEHERHQRMDELHVALGAEISFRILFLDQLALGRLDRTEHRRAALAGAVDADAEVDLVGPRVLVVQLDQREQRVGRLGGDGLEHGGRSMATAMRYRKGQSCPPREIPRGFRTEADRAFRRTSCSRH